MTIPLHSCHPGIDVKSFLLALQDETYSDRRAAERSKLPATTHAREAIGLWLEAALDLD